jgi:hypothetical protein
MQLARLGVLRLRSAANFFSSKNSIGPGAAEIPARALENHVRAMEAHMPLSIEAVDHLDRYLGIITLVQTGMDALRYYIVPPSHVLQSEAHVVTRDLLERAADDASSYYTALETGLQAAIGATRNEGAAATSQQTGERYSAP